MRSYEEIEKNAYKKAEVRLAEMRRRNTLIKRTALSSGICAAALAGVWFVSGESTRDSFKKKHDENIVTDEEMPSEEYSEQILITTTTAEISAISTTTAAADATSTDAREETTVTTTAADNTLTDVPEETAVTTIENIPEENTVTTSAKTTERTTKKTTSATTARHTTTRTSEALPLITTSKTTARPKTTSKRPTRTTTTEIPDRTTPTIDEPVPVTTTTRKIQVVMTTTTMRDSGAMNPSPPDTSTSPEPPAGEYTVVYIETPGEAEQIYKTITNKNGEQYQYVKTGIIAGLIDGSNSSLFLSVYDPEKNVIYQANPAMLVMTDNTIALKFGEHSRYWLFYQLVV